ncbi:MAG: ATP phosphoribosyltransferase [Spirochaetales bacterium]|nr:ATP phosphoribosyltransferase [Spirochaetales bacterium]
MNKEPLTIALPKGRLFEQVQEYFNTKGLNFKFEKRKLISYDEEGLLKIYLVKNSDLPAYVNAGIAGLGVCGDDVVYESGLDFYKLRSFDFGGTRLAMAALKEREEEARTRELTIATSYPAMTRDYFHEQGISVNIIKLKGSVELAPSLGLAPYIVDLVETGSTLKANGLEVVQDLMNIKVRMIANRSYFKLNYDRINDLLERIGD